MFGYWRRLPLRWQSYIFLMLTTIFWGSSHIVSKLAFEDITPMRFLFYRMATATVLTIPILVHFFYQAKNRWRLIKKVLVIETIGTILLFALSYYGVSMTNAIQASFISTASPIFVVLAAILILRERQELHEWIGMGIAVLGTVALTVLPLLSGAEPTASGSLLGNGLMIAANVCMAIYFVLAKWWYFNENKVYAVVLGFPLGAFAFLLLSWVEQVVVHPGTSLATLFVRDMGNPQVLLIAMYLGIFCSIIANTIYIIGQSNIEASEASFFNYLQPLIYIPLGIMLLGETVNAKQLFFLGIILGGVVIAEKRFTKKSYLWKWQHRMHLLLGHKPSKQIKVQQRR